MINRQTAKSGLFFKDKPMKKPTHKALDYSTDQELAKEKRKLKAAKVHRDSIELDIVNIDSDITVKKWSIGETNDEVEKQELRDAISKLKADRLLKEDDLKDAKQNIHDIEQRIEEIESGTPTSVPTNHKSQKFFNAGIPWPRAGVLSVEDGLGVAPIKSGDSPVRRAVDLVALQREINEMVYKPQASALAVAPDPLLANSSAVPVAGPAKPLLAYDLAITPPDAGIAGPVAPIAPPPVPVLSVPGSGIDPVYGNVYELPDDPEIYPLPRNPTFRDAYYHHSSKQRVEKKLAALGIKKPK